MCPVLIFWAISEVWITTLYLPPKPKSFVIGIYSGLGHITFFGGLLNGPLSETQIFRPASELREQMQRMRQTRLVRSFYIDHHAFAGSGIIVTTPYWFWALLLGGLALMPPLLHLARRREERL